MAFLSYPIVLPLLLLLPLIQFDPSSVVLVYYADKTKREKKGVLSLQNFRGIRPNVKVGTKQFVFAIETQDRKYILRASDQTTKGIWLAKLSEHCGQGTCKTIFQEGMVVGQGDTPKVPGGGGGLMGITLIAPAAFCLLGQYFVLPLLGVVVKFKCWPLVILCMATLHIIEPCAFGFCFYLAERVHHVTIPHQPLISQSEGLLNLSSPASVVVLSPEGGTIIFQIAYNLIRRLGCKLKAGVDIVWFETCKDHRPDEFVFFVVPSGTEMAQHITRELKVSIEQHTGVFLILEEAESQESMDISFISRDHYGCEEFPTTSRARILHSGLSHYHPSCASSDTPPPPSPVTTTTMRTASQPSASGPMSLDAWGRGRHKSVSATNVTSVLGRRTTLSDLHHNSLGSTASSHNSVDGLDSNIFSDAFESPPRATSPRVASPPVTSPQASSPRTSSPRAGSPRTSSPAPPRSMKQSTSIGNVNALSVNIQPTAERGHTFLQQRQLRRQIQSASNTTSTNNGPAAPPRSANSLKGAKQH